ncbi:hypothetical protein I551_9066 [Mycobacterium ulcerans str. Harvey]|uniref:Uncharacterized protein n=1 Tax=Mycobacterium ulcerans str. Harvey TaxID=1299332 RepID=A0ABN0R9Y9_MYCUL|nr:hypothetical protein I551_9066 [Mycobacterium ulcerans str. Harvey]
MQPYDEATLLSLSAQIEAPDRGRSATSGVVTRGAVRSV